MTELQVFMEFMASLSSHVSHSPWPVLPAPVPAHLTETTGPEALSATISHVARSLFPSSQHGPLTAGQETPNDFIMPLRAKATWQPAQSLIG